MRRFDSVKLNEQLALPGFRRFDLIGGTIFIKSFGASPEFRENTEDPYRKQYQLFLPAHDPQNVWFLFIVRTSQNRYLVAAQNGIELRTGTLRSLRELNDFTGDLFE